MQTSFDLLVIGGGINGTAIARDAAGRGLSVLLCEKDDLANHTSSASTKLIHGGLRYLEHYEFRLVRESLKEREVLLRAAPHIISPLRFVLPYDKGLRPKWMLRAGLFLYDSLGGREILPGTKTVNLHKGRNAGVLEARLKTGFEYSDCWVEDARLVVLNAVDAQQRGAVIQTRTCLTNITAHEIGYAATLMDETGVARTVTARAAINAAGPWVEEILLNMQDSDEPSNLRLVKGSHIITRKLFDGDQAYIFQNADNRIIFAIPYETDFTLIGTTDVAHAQPGDLPKASADEIAYLCEAANDYLKHDISPSDVVWTYSGVRPLYDDKSANASAVTRDYVLDIDEFSEKRPFLSVYGGKITTSRKLAEHVLEKLGPYFDDMGGGWTRAAALPGGDIDNADFERFYSGMSRRYPKAEPSMLRRLCKSYGTKAEELLGGKTSMDDMGQHFGAGLTEAEVDYLVQNEWAKTTEDILWRRSKLGLHMTSSQQDAFGVWFKVWFKKRRG